MILVRALLAMTLILNGMTIPPAAAMHAAAAASAASHAGHHPPDSALGDSHADHSAGMPGGDCCEGLGCDCGCAVSQAATPPITLPRTAWQATLSEFTFVVKSFHSSPLAAPFRPPA